MVRVKVSSFFTLKEILGKGEVKLDNCDTTIGGLFIAVPMNVIYTVVIGKITKIVDSIDEHAVKFINLVQRVK